MVRLVSRRPSGSFKGLCEGLVRRARAKDVGSRAWTRGRAGARRSMKDGSSIISSAAFAGHARMSSSNSITPPSPSTAADAADAVEGVSWTAAMASPDACAEPPRQARDEDASRSVTPVEVRRTCVAHMPTARGSGARRE